MKLSLRVFTCTSFQGVWPVGNAAVIVAYDVEEATNLLNTELISRELPPITSAEIDEISLESPNVQILCDGDY